jgi:TetR/AcrR family transcriptional regulator, transcriptional repressor for nem operon
MRKSRDAASETRRKIVKTAARQFRKHGFGGIGVADVMAKSGLTHGGFYKHFASKNALVTEACEWALAASRNELAALAEAAPPGQGLDAIVCAYLSMEHRDHAERGCVISALAAEAVRLDAPTKKAFSEGQEAQVSLIAALLPGTKDDAMQSAGAILAIMVGALTISRTIDDRELAEKFLQSVRTAALKLCRT